MTLPCIPVNEPSRRPLSQLLEQWELHCETQTAIVSQLVEELAGIALCESARGMEGVQRCADTLAVGMHLQNETIKFAIKERFEHAGFSFWCVCSE